MNVTNFPNFYNIQQRSVQQATPMAQLVSMLNDKAEDQSPLEAAQQALLDAKAKLDEHRNEQIESALGGYCALRSRQTSYFGVCPLPIFWYLIQLQQYLGMFDPISLGSAFCDQLLQHIPFFFS